jgi:hypothetical protein
MNHEESRYRSRESNQDRPRHECQKRSWFKLIVPDARWMVRHDQQKHDTGLAVISGVGLGPWTILARLAKARLLLKARCVFESSQSAAN